MNKIPDDLIPLGKIIKPYGIKGQIKFKPYNENSSILKKGVHVWLRKEENFDFQFFKINSINYNSLNPVIQFNDLDNRDKALEIRQYTLYISKSILSNNKNEIYFVDLIGCKVYDQSESFIGTAEDILHFKGDNHVMVIKNGDKEFLVPIRNDLIKLFDVDERYVIVEIIDGLVNN